MPSVAVSKEALSFLIPVREFTIHNATDEQLVIMYAGETRYIPPVNVAIPPDPRIPDKAHSAVDADGELIPGTLVLKDMYDEKMGHFRDASKFWSAAEAIKHSLDIDVTTGEATGPYAQKGLSLLPPLPTKAQVAETLADGRARYKTWLVAKAQETIESYDAKSMARKAAGLGSIPPSREELKAKAILDANQARLEESVEKQLAFGEDTDAELDTNESELQFLAFAKAKCEKLAAATVAEAPDTTKTPEELVSDLMNSPQAMKLMRQQFKMRKLRGA